MLPVAWLGPPLAALRYVLYFLFFSTTLFAHVMVRNVSDATKAYI